LPEGGEKKSLTDTRKNTIDLPQKEIKLHYFPDIPVEDALVDPTCPSGENSFKRIHFETDGCPCAQTQESIEEPEADDNSTAAAEIEEQAYRKGFDEGQKAALESQREQVESAVKGLEQAVVHIQNMRNEIYHTLEREVVELALAIARKVVCQEVKTNKDVVVCVAKEALSRVEAPGIIKIRINPADFQFIQETKNQISTLLEHVDKVTFEAEDSISSGGCVIETNLGEIDARIEKQLRVVEEMFQTEIAKAQPEGNVDQLS
jgi:flagellar assembly protein FliH